MQGSGLGRSRGGSGRTQPAGLQVCEPPAGGPGRTQPEGLEGRGGPSRVGVGRAGQGRAGPSRAGAGRAGEALAVVLSSRPSGGCSPRQSQAVPLHRALLGACGQSQVPSAPWGLVSWEPSSWGLGPNRASTRWCYHSGGRRKPPKEHGVWLVIFPGDKSGAPGEGVWVGQLGRRRQWRDECCLLSRRPPDEPGTTSLIGSMLVARWDPGELRVPPSLPRAPGARGTGWPIPTPLTSALGGATSLGGDRGCGPWRHWPLVGSRAACPPERPRPLLPQAPPPPRPLGPSRTPPPARGPSPVPSSGICRRRVCSPSRV